MFILKLSKLNLLSISNGTRQFSCSFLLNVRTGRFTTSSSSTTSSTDKLVRSLQPTKRIINKDFTNNLIKRKDFKLLFNSPTDEIIKSILKQGDNISSNNNKIPNKLLHKLLFSRKIELKLFYFWLDLLKSKNLIYSLTKLNLLLSSNSVSNDSIVSGSSSSSQEEREDRSQINYECPNWLFLLLPNLLKTLEDVPYLISLLTINNFKFKNQLNSIEKSIFISRILINLLKVNHFISIRELIFWFNHENQDELLGFLPTSNGLELTKNEQLTYSSNYTRIFKSLSQQNIRISNSYKSTPSNLIHSLVNQLKNSMKRRGVKPTLLIYQLQFTSSLIPTEPKEASKLLLEMNNLGFEINLLELHSVMKCYTKNGDKRGAEVLLNTMKEAKESGKIIISEAKVLKKEHRKNAINVAEEGVLGKKVNKDTRTDKKTLKKRAMLEAEAKKLLDQAIEEKKEENLVVDDLLLPSIKIDPILSATSTSTPSITSPQSEILVTSPDTKSTTPPLSTNDNPIVKIRPYKKYHTTYLSSLQSDPQAAIKYFNELRLISPESIDSITWTTLLRVVCRSNASTTEEILDLMEGFERFYSTPQSSSQCRSGSSEGIKLSNRSRRLKKFQPLIKLLPIKNYTIIFQSLLIKNSPTELINLWNILKIKGLKPDNYLLNLISRAYFNLDDIPSGLRLLYFYAFRDGIDPPLLSSSSTHSLSRPYNHRPTIASTLENLKPKPHSVKLDIININSLLTAYSRSGDYNEVFNLIDSSGQNYLLLDFGIDWKKGEGIDSASLCILLDTARLCSAQAGRGWAPPGVASLSPSHSSSSSFNTNFSNSIGQSNYNYKDDNWGGQPAYKYSENLIFNLLESNFPLGLEWVENEIKFQILKGRHLSSYNIVNGLTGSSSSSSSFSSSSSSSSGSTLLNWLLPSSPSTSPQFFPSTLSPSLPPSPHPQIHPSPLLFASLIPLIGYHSTPSSLLRAFAWMKYLDLKPSRKTLGIGMMYLFESGLGGREREGVRGWLEGWLGGSEVPGEEELAGVRGGGRGGRR